MKWVMIVVMGVMSVCGVGVNVLMYILMLVGSYKFNMLSMMMELVNGGNVYMSIENAFDYGNSVAYIIVEFRTFMNSFDNWDKMDMNYDLMLKIWVEDVVVNYVMMFNEWIWIFISKVLRGINGVIVVVNSLEAYIVEVVVIVKVDMVGIRFEVMCEIIEKIVWDVVGY